MVIFLFLGRATDTLIPAVALPLSLLLTFIVMDMLGYSLDNLSLMALTLAIGFLVDDAIVFLENTVRRMEEGQSPKGRGDHRRRSVASDIRLDRYALGGWSDRSVRPPAAWLLEYRSSAPAAGTDRQRPARRSERCSPRPECEDSAAGCDAAANDPVGRPDHDRTVSPGGGCAGSDSRHARSAGAARRAGPRVRPCAAARSAGGICAAAGGDRLLALSASAFLKPAARLVREEVCDNYVLRQGDAPSYAETLLEISQRFLSKRPQPAALGLFHPYGRLERRVAELLNPRRNVMVRVHRVAFAVLAALFSSAVIVVACTRLLQAEPPTSLAAPVVAPAEKQAEPALPTSPSGQSADASLNIIQPFDVLRIDAMGTLLDQPIDDFYLVEPDGQVALGPAYGRANVKGLTWEQAENRIVEQLKKGVDEARGSSHA